MIPRTRAGYAAGLLAIVAVVLNVLRVYELAAHLPLDEALSVAASSALTASLGSLVYVVHANGGRR